MPENTNNTHAEQFTYGIEFELTLPHGSLNNDGGVARALNYSGANIDALPGWKLKTDVSINPGRGRFGAELVSPVLRGADGLKSIKTALDWINARGAKVNPSCGTHVHVGWSHAQSADVTRRLVCLVANFEQALFAANGTKARNDNRYCHAIKGSAAYRDAYERPRAARRRRVANRYQTLNLTNLVEGSRKQTVEFRVFAPTHNFEKAVAYIRLCVGLCERALNVKRVAKWDAKQPTPTSPITRGGEGETAMNRLMYQLGWTKGRVKTPHGHVGSLDGNLPSLIASKRELLRLAKRYDASPAQVTAPW